MKIGFAFAGLALGAVLVSCQHGPTTPSAPTRAAVLPAAGMGAGLTAIDARWSNYGAYLRRMIDTVQIEWERFIATAMKQKPAAGGVVTVRFVMNDGGKIAEIIKVEPNALADEVAARACVSAITSRAPYGPWTDEMRAALGVRQEMTFTFNYQ